MRHECLKKLKNKFNTMEQLIINIALEIVKLDFMQYPDFDETINFTLLDAMTVILAQHLEDIETCEIFDFLSTKLIN